MTRLFLSIFTAALFLRAAVAADSPASLRKALEAEATGDLDLRKQQLAAALEAAPDDPETRWQNGYVRMGAKWVKAEDFYRHVPAKAALEDYRDLRKKSTPTVDSQLKLADFCKSRGLREQERVHLSAVIELEPDHAAARQRLGHQRVNGEWTSKEEWEATKETAKKVAETLRKHRGELNGLREGLDRGKISKREAIERVQKNASVEMIPAWEMYLSSGSQVGSEVTVAVLAAMTEDEASLSLTRHAMYSPYPAAATAATEALKKRNFHSFVPTVLNSLRSRWTSTSQMLQSSADRIVYRYTLFADGPDMQQLSVLEDVFYMSGWLPDAARQTASASSINQQTIEQRRAAENRRIEEENERAMSFLRDVTGETTADSPQTWWQWWCDANGIYFEGDKPLEQSYAANYTSIVGRPPPPPVTGGGGPPPRSPRPPREPKDCLAGGTPVWTDQGPVAVDRVRMGDLVLARDLKTGELAYRPVLRTTVRAPEKLFRIELAKDNIRASGGHPFWVSGKGWTKARELQPGMVLAGLPEPQVVKQVSEEEKPVRSFNLIVEGFHSYFAGSSPILSHDNSIPEAKPLLTNRSR